MHYNTPCDASVGWENGFVLDLDSLAAYFERLPDQRCARGKRYRLAHVCVLATLAKLSGEGHPLGMAQWAQLRQPVLGPLLGLAKRLPCHNTYRRVLGGWVGGGCMGYGASVGCCGHQAKLGGRSTAGGGQLLNGLDVLRKTGRIGRPRVIFP